MKVLLSGASSFTGFWFVRALAERGHTVYATFQRSQESYEGIRRRRILELPKGVRCIWETSMDSPRLVDLVREEGKFDVLCLHGAFVTGYRSPDFDAVAALQRNTSGLDRLLTELAKAGLRHIIATGSVFEADEGAGEEPLRAFSAYGLSKTLTWKVQQYLAQQHGLNLGKFIIPNPFGAYEEPRFTAYLLKTWSAGKVAEVRTPLYVRDNIHVSQLAIHYANYVQDFVGGCAEPRFGPMGYVETQGAFAQRFAKEMSSRLGYACELVLGSQTEFSEPLVRINTHIHPLAPSEWNETAAWDDLAAWYKES